MSSPSQTSVSPADGAAQSAPAPVGVVVVRLWAAAKAAAGVAEVALEVTGPVSVAWVRAAVVDRAAESGRDRLERVLQVCSVLVGDRPRGVGDPEDPVVGPGSTVEFLPPFAGG